VNVPQLSQGVFQVVVPRVEDDGVQYKEPLPVDLLPYEVRNDKFVSIGTAFAISPTHFVTAAHLFAMPLKTSIEHYYLRNASGVPHEIGTVTKFSQYRDLVEFTLVDSPADVVPLETRKDVKIGELVRTVGNAHGEGVILRDGLLTSLTSEPVDGKWKFLRFSAPASPGNSGGPLVDSEGRALGVVVRKSGAENLNFAVPIDELDKLSSQRSEFWIKGIPFSQDGKQIHFDWAFASRLPASLALLRAGAVESLNNKIVAVMSEFETKFTNEIFPNHPNLGAYLREPNLPFGLGSFAVDGNGKWRIDGAQYKNTELAPGQNARLSVAENKSEGRFVIDRPSGMSLTKFFESPKLLADTIVHSLSWVLTFAGRKIGIESFGEPASKERWLDDYGRPWFTFTWPLKRSDSVFVLNCTTNPGGWACFWNRTQIAIEDALRVEVKLRAQRTVFTYYGHIKDWEEFQQVPDTYKPKILRNVSVRFDKQLKFAIGPYAGNVNLPLLSDTSMLTVFTSLDPIDRHNLRITEVDFSPRKDKSYTFALWQVMEPVANSSEAYAQRWKNIRQSSPPYDDVPVVDGNKQIIRSVGKLKKPSRLGDLYLYYCTAGTEDSKAEFAAACSGFQESVRFEPSEIQ
jgi:hypothetical protein